MKTLVATLLLLCAYACQKSTVNRVAIKPGYLPLVNKQNAPLGGFFMSSQEANAKIDPQVTLGSSGVIEGFDAPVINIQLGNSDFVQLLRCNSKYQLKSPSGGAWEEASQSSRSWIWAQAIDDRSQCRIVGTNVRSPRFVDLSAASGSFYYVMNPCVAAEHAADNKEACSYNLMTTESITFKNPIKETLRQKAIELSEAEATLTAEVQNAMLLAQKIELHLRTCEDQFARDKSVMTFKTGITRLGISSAAAVFGFFVFPAGPTGAVMAGSMVGQMGTVLVISNVLKWPNFDAISNECVNTEVIATTAAQREENDKKSANGSDLMSGNTHVEKITGSYEEKYGVQALIKKLDAAISQDGSLPKAQAQVEKILKEMAALDERVITMEQAYAQVGRNGGTFAPPSDTTQKASSKAILPDDGMSTLPTGSDTGSAEGDVSAPPSNDSTSSPAADAAAENKATK